MDTFMLTKWLHSEGIQLLVVSIKLICNSCDWKCLKPFKKSKYESTALKTEAKLKLRELYTWLNKLIYRLFSNNCHRTNSNNNN